jgi:carboxyl-terminal processing protease
VAGAQPFAGEPRAVVVLPEGDPTLAGEATLLEIERAGFEAELGAPVEISTSETGGARWVLVLDPDLEGPPRTSYDPGERLLVSSASDVGGLFEAMSLGRTAVRDGGTHAVTDCMSIDDAVERVVAEVADTYPAFELRRLDWSEICERHVDSVRASRDPLAALQRWLAELDDGHTWVWAAVGNLPYAVRVDGASATFARVLKGTAGHELGVRPGWALSALDGELVDAAGWLARAAAPPHARQLIAGRRLLAGPPGVPRALTARSPRGEEVTWEEAPGPPAAPIVSWTSLDDDTGYVRVAAWVAGPDTDDALETALTELRGRERLVLDLRGNPGGNLVLASRTRDRFLRDRTELGSIRYSIGGGELSRSFPLLAEPADGVERWAGRLLVLTDALTFSSSEDFLLGLQGLEHVKVVGGPTGGGSGRPRALRLLPGMTLTISTALTYDRVGRCVEGVGIPVDVVVSGSDEEVLAAARAL